MVSTNFLFFYPEHMLPHILTSFSKKFLFAGSSCMAEVITANSSWIRCRISALGTGGGREEGGGGGRRGRHTQ
jgi:hypothetical protein